MKQCFICLEYKPLDDFHKHPRMKDGHINKCKECTKAYSRQHRRDNQGYYLPYDKKRNKEPERQVKVRRRHDENKKQWPEKYRARSAVTNAVRDRRLVKEPCSVCGDKKSQGHHEDYSKPLDVIWYCVTHHAARHAELNAIARGRW